MSLLLSKWEDELTAQKSVFREHSHYVVAWDSVILQNAAQLERLGRDVGELRAGQEQLEATLAGVESHQMEMDAVLSRLESELDRLGTRGGSGGGDASAAASAASSHSHYAAAYSSGRSAGGSGAGDSALINSLRSAGVGGDAGAVMPERDEAHRAAEDVQAMLNDLSDTLSQLITKANDEFAREQSNPVSERRGAAARGCAQRIASMRCGYRRGLVDTPHCVIFRRRRHSSLFLPCSLSKCALFSTRRCPRCRRSSVRRSKRRAARSKRARCLRASAVGSDVCVGCEQHRAFIFKDLAKA